jgi:hypothetical protein
VRRKFIGLFELDVGARPGFQRAPVDLGGDREFKPIFDHGPDDAPRVSVPSSGYKMIGIKGS